MFKIVIREGTGIDVASCYETQCALESGAPPEQLDLNGNCKEDFLIARAIRTDMLIVADSIEEFQAISGIAKQMGKGPRVLVDTGDKLKVMKKRDTYEEIFSL